MEMAQAEAQLPSSQPETSTSSSTSATTSADVSSFRSMRKRKLNLNHLSSSLHLPQVCQFQFCGVQLRDGDSLEWHYEAHLTQELGKLDRVRVKRNPKDFPDRTTRQSVRKSTFEKIRFRRESRKALPASSRINSTSGNTSLRCPVCDQCVEAESDEDLKSHVDACLRIAEPEEDTDIEQENEVDVDGADSFEEYEWAGQHRVRATSLFEGGLRGAGFLTIVRGDEDEVLDIENDTEEEKFGRVQYTDRDVILPKAETEEEEAALARLREATIGKGSQRRSEDICDIEDAQCSVSASFSKTDLAERCDALVKENLKLRQAAMCNVCMDSYSEPVTSVACWHVHCEQCWLRALGTKRLCPQCKVITRPQDLRKIYL